MTELSTLRDESGDLAVCGTIAGIPYPLPVKAVTLRKERLHGAETPVERAIIIQLALEES